MRVFLPILLCVISSGEGVEILGLFLRNVHNGSIKPDRSYHTTGDVWSRQCIAMFRAAVSLANQYNIRIHNENISSSVIRTNNDENGHAALNLVCQYITSQHSNIVGIVGPASSGNTRFVGPFAAHIELPVISYAATNADFSDTQHYPKFYRTVPSDRLLAHAIVQLFEIYKWKTFTMIYQKDDYGYGGLKILSESYHENVTIKERLAFDGHVFHADLKKILIRSQSRIVLVWADEKETTSIIEKAFYEGLIGAPYVWITTDKVILDTLPLNMSELKKQFEGLLTIMPPESDSSSSYQDSMNINKTLFKEALAAWSSSSEKEDRDEYPHGDKHISSFAMFAFDATWTLIQALNKTSFDNQSSSPCFVSSPYCFNSSLKNADSYHKHLRATNFSGISGLVTFSDELSNDRVGGAYYALKNMQWNSNQLRYEKVMIWHQEIGANHGNWQNVTERHIVWPNRSEETPTDHPRIRGDKLRVRVIESPPFVMFWNKSSKSQEPPNAKLLDTIDNNIKIYGYVADLIVELQKKMHFQLTIDAVPPNTSYNILVESVSLNDSWDVAISDITITSNRRLTADFSSPICENAVRIVVRENPSFSISFFSFLRPFSPQVWLSVIGLIFYSGLLVYLFERKQITENKEKQVLGTVIIGTYHALSSVVGMGADLPLRTTSSRIMTIALFALSAILAATYTANLSSFLTLQRTKPSISGIDDIKNGRLPFQRIGIVNDSAIVDYYTQNVSTEYYPLQNTKEIYTFLLENRIDAALWDATALEYIVDQHYCRRLSVVGVGFAKSSFGIAMRKNWQYKADLDVNILSLRESTVLEKLEHKWFSKRICNNDVKTTWEEDGIPMAIMSGLFLTFLMVSAIAVGLHLWNSQARIVENLKSKIAIIREMRTRLMKP